MNPSTISANARFAALPRPHAPRAMLPSLNFPRVLAIAAIGAPCLLVSAADTLAPDALQRAQLVVDGCTAIALALGVAVFARMAFALFRITADEGYDPLPPAPDGEVGAQLA